MESEWWSGNQVSSRLQSTSWLQDANHPTYLFSGAPRRSIIRSSRLFLKKAMRHLVITGIVSSIGNLRMQCTISGRLVVDAASWRQLERFLIDDHHLEYWSETCRFCSFWQSRSRCRPEYSYQLRFCSKLDTFRASDLQFFTCFH